MSSVTEIILAGTLVAVVLFATYSFGNAWSRRKVEQNFESPEDILTAVDVYIKYGRQQPALDLLQSGLQRYPDHPTLQLKLAELTSPDNNDREIP